MQWAFPPAFLLGELSGRPAAQKASFSFWVLHFMRDDARQKGREKVGQRNISKENVCGHRPKSSYFALWTEEGQTYGPPLPSRKSKISLLNPPHKKKTRRADICFCFFLGKIVTPASPLFFASSPFLGRRCKAERDKCVYTSPHCLLGKARTRYPFFQKVKKI